MHFHDINKLLKSINALVEHGHSVILIEHNQEVIKSSDWVIDLGPEAGRLLLHLLHQLGPHDAVREPGVVLHVRRHHELAAGVEALQHERGKVGATGVHRGGEARATGAYDDDVFDGR